MLDLISKFLSVLSDSTFVKLHLERSKRKKCMAIIKYKKGYNVVTFPLSHLLEKIATNSVYRLKFNDVTRVVDSCIGLLCLVGHSYTTEHTNFWFRIGNLATRILSKKLGSFHEHSNRVPHRLNFAFGHDKSNRIYKVVVLSSSGLKVFSLGDNIWRKIFCVPPYDLVINLSSRCVNRGAYLSGTVNWIFIYQKEITMEKYVVISLDLSTETYKKLLPPLGVDDVTPYVDPTIAVLIDCLWFSQHPNYIHFVIWKMTEFGVEHSWTQFLKINFQNLQGVDKFSGWKHYKLFLFPLCFSENGHTLLLANSRKSDPTLYNLREIE
jgi:F-box interacting protein